MSSSEDYLAKAAEALAQLAEAKTEAERSRLRRSHGAYLRLAAAESCARTGVAREAASKAAIVNIVFMAVSNIGCVGRPPA